MAMNPNKWVDTTAFKVAVLRSGLQQQDVAKHLDISPSFLSKIVNNKRSDYSLKLLERINHFIEEHYHID